MFLWQTFNTSIDIPMRGRRRKHDAASLWAERERRRLCKGRGGDGRQEEEEDDLREMAWCRSLLNGR